MTRPWPTPSIPWVMRQTWEDLLFMHWPVRRERLQPLMPPALPIDMFGGDAWVTISPFVVTGLRMRGLPPIPGLSRFPELNLRTYVTIDGKPGVYFFSLDAGSRVAVAAARLVYQLPYHHADMHVDHRDDWIVYRSQRRDSDAALSGRYRPVGERAVARQGTLDYFLTERYALYTVTRTGIVLRGEIDHPPWELQPAEAEIDVNTLPLAHDLPALDTEPVLHFSRRQPTRIWPPLRVPMPAPILQAV
jgi:uncharacterized protein YqjF (DUF2071 family)